MSLTTGFWIFFCVMTFVIALLTPVPVWLVGAAGVALGVWVGIALMEGGSR
jgi:hypothetical protein